MNKITKPILILIVTLVVLVIGCQRSQEPSNGASPQNYESAQVGNRAPDFELNNLEGQLVSLGDLRGKPVLINFWATWCPPCRAEMPYLQQIYEEWSDKGLVLLAINIGESDR